MQAKVKWTDGVQFVAESGSGHALVVDGSLEAGGRNKIGRASCRERV